MQAFGNPPYRSQATVLPQENALKKHNGFFRRVLGIGATSQTDSSAQRLRQSTGGVTTLASQEELRLVERHYTLQHKADIFRFLNENSFLVPLLLEGYSIIHTFFPGALLILELVSSPDGIENQQLVIYITTKLPPQDALESLAQLDEAWWLDIADYAHDKMFVNLAL